MLSKLINFVKTFSNVFVMQTENRNISLSNNFMNANDTSLIMGPSQAMDIQNALNIRSLYGDSNLPMLVFVLGLSATKQQWEYN